MSNINEVEASVLRDLEKLIGRLPETKTKDGHIIFLNISFGDEEFVTLSEQLTSSGIHLVSVCNRQNLIHNFRGLVNADIIYPIKPPQRSQLFKVYYAIVGHLVRDNYIEYFIDLQYRAGIYHRKFGIEFFRSLRNNK